MFQNSSSWDNTATDYDSASKDITFHYASKSFDLSGAKEEIQKEKNLKILDIGCGTGDLGIAIAQFSKNIKSDLKIYSTDFSKGMIDRATEKSKTFSQIECLIMDGQKLEFKDEEVDFTFSMFAFFFFPNRKKCLDEMYRVLKPKGKVVLSIWTKNHFGEFLFATIKRCNIQMEKPSYVPVKDKEMLISEMTEAKFQNIETFEAENLTTYNAEEIDVIIKGLMSNPMYTSIVSKMNSEELKNFIETLKDEILKNYTTEDGKTIKFVTKALIGIGNK